MADHADMQEHVSTYDRVIGMLKWGTAVVVVITAIVVLLIS